MSATRRTLRRLLGNRLGLAGIGLSVLLALIAVAPGAFTDFNPVEGDNHAIFLAPGVRSGLGLHWFGTDYLGRDVLSRVVHGARISLGAAAVVVLVSSAGGLVLGLLAGYRGGWTDTVIMRLADIQLAFPVLLLAVVIMALLGPGLQNLVPTLIVLGWAQYTRVIRGQVLSEKEREYVLASRAAGAGQGHVMFRHLAPNVLPIGLVLATLHFGRIIIVESALSFLGLGALPPTPTWGSMLAHGRDYLFNAWWIATFPGIAIFVASLGFNLLGEALRTALDPRDHARASAGK